MKVLIVDDSFSWCEFHKNALDEIFIELGCQEYTIDVANFAQEGYSLIMQNNNEPYDLIITDLQMEEDFAPKYAGEWFVEQIKTFSSYFNTKIIISSGSYNIKQIADDLGVFCLPKRIAVSDINQYKDIVMSVIK